MIETLIAILQMIVWLFLLPLIIGGYFQRLEQRGNQWILRWIGGQMLLWGAFQLLCVPMVLEKMAFHQVRQGFCIITACLMLGALVYSWYCHRKPTLRLVREQKTWRTKATYLLWVLFFVILLFQLVQSVRMTYADGDDAYYVAISSITQDADTMYQKLAYTGESSEVDIRHGLAPFPVWISFLADMMGIQAVIVAHVVVATFLIGMTYGIYYLLASHLFAAKRERIPLFLLFTELLVLFGDYSFQSPENFMIARSRQGKAALGNIVIPMLFYLLLLLLEKLQEQKKQNVAYWVLLLAVMLTACLTSTMGALLAAMLIGITGICIGACYRKWKPVCGLAVTCVPCVCYALLYLMN